MKRRIISLVLVLSLLIGAGVRPQRVDAVALTATVVAASAAAILTACGVTYWASSETNAVNYISNKIDDYLTSIGESEISYDEWLELNAGSNIFDVVSGGVMQFTSGVANKLLDFCRWLQEDEDIQSGGEDIVSGTSIVEVNASRYFGEQGAQWNYTATSNTWQLNYTIPPEIHLNQNGYIQCLIPVDHDVSTVIVSVSSSNVNYPTRTSWGIAAFTADNVDSLVVPMTANYLSVGSSKSVDVTGKDYVKILYQIYGSYTFEGDVTWKIDGSQALANTYAKITPSDFVNVPADIASGETFSVTPSVSLTSGDSVDSATEAILDGITSQDGLSSTVEETPGTAWGWLYTLLVNIANAITDGVSNIKQAVIGLADSIYNKFTTVLQDIKSGITTIVNSITSAVSQLLSAIQALPTTIYNQFTQVLQDIKTGIQGIALDIYTDVINALTYVFVPSQAFIDTYVASLYATFDNHFSILSYPFSILGEFITRASGIGSPEPVFSWGNIYEPFSGRLLISSGSYNLNSALSNQTFAYMYQLYMIIVKGFMSFWFLTYLYNWFCDVFKMREADYSPPEVDDI